MYLKTNQFHVQQFAYLLERMKSIDEGGQSLLDNSMILFGSNLFDGDSHGAEQMPLLIAGKGGGLKPGRNLDYLEKGDDNRRACSLYLSLMDRMGVQIERFGDTEKRLVDLYALGFETRCARTSASTDSRRFSMRFSIAICSSSASFDSWLPR